MGLFSGKRSSNYSLEQVMDLEKAYVLQNYGRYPLLLVRGEGSYVWDDTGKEYLDLISGIGVNGLGHAHPRILKVIQEQAALMIHSSNLYYHPYQGLLAKRLASISGLQRTFFANTGTEAMEGAIKMVRSHGHRVSASKFEIVSLENSFHGRSTGALALTGQPKYRKDFEPLLPGVKYVPRGDLSALEAAVTENTAGIVLEVVQGEGGIYPLEESYLRAARALADKHNALLVFDEIQCGVGRLGCYFAYQMCEPAVMPDVMVTAKPIAAGLPLGVICMNEKAAVTIAAGMHGTTFGGGPLACRVGLEALEILEELLPHIREVGAYFKAQLQKLSVKHRMVKEVRGAGLMLGMELDRPGKDIVVDAMNEGLLINCTNNTVLRFLPPFVLRKKDVDRAVKGLDRVLKRAA
ncbi:MAG: aspartate aminotransferase family protein [Bryobacterales bacterium]|nr:aspartate aminotransferase family protein [Bryobacterales bacterium]